MRTNLIEKYEWSKYVSPSSDKLRPVYNWFPYKHGYSSALVDKLITEMEIRPGMTVFDPFCGSGTTLLVCKENGISSLGLDIMPFATFLSNTKLENYDFDKLKKHIWRFQKSRIGFKKNIKSDITTLELAYDKRVLQYINFLKAMINRTRDKKYRNLLFMALLAVIEKCSNTEKSGGFLRLIERKVTPTLVKNLFVEKLLSIASDIKSANRKKKSGKAILGDSRKYKSKEKFDAVITSPPYPNRHDYTRIYLLELALGFIESNQEIKELRYNTLRSHVEAKSPDIETNFEIPKALRLVIERVKNGNPNNPAILKMLSGYFEDMHLSLMNIKRNLKRNAKVAFVVSNVRYCGVNVKVDTILAKIGEGVGLSIEKILVLRNRGNSPQQMVKYRRIPNRESVVIWKNTR